MTIPCHVLPITGSLRRQSTNTALLHAAQDLAPPGTDTTLYREFDWSIGDGEAGSIYAKPVCWLNASPRGAIDAHASLRTVLSYADATIVEAACVTVPISSGELEAGAIVLDQKRATQVREALEHLVATVAHRVSVTRLSG